MYLLLAAVLLVQDQTAEETFKKIEETLLQAKTLKVRFSFERTQQVNGQVVQVKGSGDLLIQEGNKLNIYAVVDFGDRKKTTRLVGDGTRMLTLRDEKPTNPSRPIWPKLGDRMTVGFLRAGIGSIDRYVVRNEPEPGEETDVRKRLVVSDFKAGENDGEKRTIKFRCTVTGQRETHDVTLTYDPKTFRLFSRFSRLSVGDGEYSEAQESYDEFVFNAEIPGDPFKVPEDKK